jgi:5-carboxymethyl-2-hydroxymuconate isomerase
MAHAIIEWSANLQGQLDLDGLMRLIADDMANNADGAFPIGGIRIRAYRADDYLIADGTSKDDCFVNIDFKLGVGRSEAFRQAYFGRLAQRLMDFLADLFEGGHFAFTMYVSEVDGWKKNAIHQRLTKG